MARRATFREPNIFSNESPLEVAGKMIFLFHSWDMLFPRRVTIQINMQNSESMYGNHV